ncbi:MAG TPA: HTTM domain-containing protein [Cytophagaceae bacterium]
MKDYFNRSTSAAPLAVFRMVFGIMLFFSVIRFWSKGWIEELYINPKYFFSYYGFDFVVPLGNYTYILFILCGLSALLVALGLFYRPAIITLFLSFTYIELMDKSTYLNHYYFISMISFLMIFLPANVYFSIDAYRNKQLLAGRIPQWSLDSVKLFVGMLYFFAGLAKVNSDWLLEAMPLKIWLPARNDMPVIGFLFNYPWTPYVFSWFGCLYDLFIPFMLWNSKTRPLAYIAVIVFHGLTSLLFPIGMFPYIMIVTALIFFSDKFHLKVIQKISGLLNIRPDFLQPHVVYTYKGYSLNLMKGLLAIFFIIQFLMPFRYLCYPGDLFWTEQGYRFSWRVMLMEKAGLAEFKVKDATGKEIIVNNNDFLTPLQEKMMATQPDMILQFAHILRDYYSKQGFIDPQVYVDSYVALNGRLGRAMISPETDLAKEKESFKHKSWIILYND